VVITKIDLETLVVPFRFRSDAFSYLWTPTTDRPLFDEWIVRHDVPPKAFEWVRERDVDL
jgi:hypothetical protein